MSNLYKIAALFQDPLNQCPMPINGNQISYIILKYRLIGIDQHWEELGQIRGHDLNLIK